MESLAFLAGFDIYHGANGGRLYSEVFGNSAIIVVGKRAAMQCVGYLYK